MNDRNEMSPAEELVDLYNKIDAHLRLRYGLNSDLGFGQEVDSYGGQSKSDRVREERRILWQAGRIRNLLDHDKWQVNGSYVYTCQPESHIIKGLRKIWNKLDVDVKAIDCWPKSEIAWLEMNSRVSEALSLHDLQDYSQFPIADSEEFVNICTTVDIGKWLASRVVEKSRVQKAEERDAIFDLDGHVVQEVIEHKGKVKNYSFADPNAKVFEIIRLFRETDRLEAVFLSPGRSRKKPMIQRIVTNWDIMNYLDR